MGEAGKCTFGTKLPIDIHMLNEVIYREVKHFRNYKIYRPNFGSLFEALVELMEFPFPVRDSTMNHHLKTIPVTGKFYAAHDQIKAETLEQTQKIDTYQYNVTQSRAKGPHSKYPVAATENQVYGWYLTPLEPMDRNDRRFYNPKRESPHTKIEIVILMSNPKAKK